MFVREVALEAVKVDENVAMWTIICRTTVYGNKNTPPPNRNQNLEFGYFCCYIDCYFVKTSYS